ncbi:MAG: response regulator [Desulfobacterales bacterium]|nr:response regulator [Desulfobacterales bacterium]
MSSPPRMVSERWRLLDSSPFDIIITDLRMPGADGMALLEGTKARHPDTGVIVVTGFATVPSVVDAMKKGACSYITKPYKLDDVARSGEASPGDEIHARTA